MLKFGDEVSDRESETTKMSMKALSGSLTFSSLTPCDFTNCTKRQIKEYFENSYDLNESLFTSLKDDSVFYKCPDRLRLPLIFYYGHTACVYMNKCILAGLVKPEQRIKPEYESMFETGVDEFSWDDTENYRMGGNFKWPKVKDVAEYRRQVKELLLRTIDSTPLQLPVTMENPWWGLFMGMEHERIHLETSSVLIRQLPLSMVNRPKGWKYAPAESEQAPGKNIMIRVNKTNTTLGKPKDFPSFGWDNEYGELNATVPAFEASRYLTSNREFLHFVRDGGYEKAKYWTEEGWRWVQYKQATHPLFWVCNDGCKCGCGGDLASYSHCQQMTNGQNYCSDHHQEYDNGHQRKDEGGGHQDYMGTYRYRCMFDVIDMPWDWPVEINYHEAKAFCCWKGPNYRLLCEAEHNVIRALESPVTETKFDIIYQDDIKANLNMKYGSSTPVNMFPPSRLGFYDTFGNVWEWTEDHFNGLPGFKTHFLYDDFSIPTFDGRHNVILGGSWISTGDEASRFSRYAFRRHFFQHCGFRVARSVANSEQREALPVRFVESKVFVQGAGLSDSPILLDKELGYIPTETSNCYYQYDGDEILNEMLRFEYSSENSFPVALSNRCRELVEMYGVPLGSALHLGCATGRCTFDLGKVFDKVIGQDFSGRFIEACQQLQEGKNLTYTDFDGFKKLRKEVMVPQDLLQDNVSFIQLSWLPNEVPFCEFIVASNLDRIENVKAWTVRLPELLCKNGLLVVASSGTWDEKALAPLLAHEFDLKESQDLHYSDNGMSQKARISVWAHNAIASHIPWRDD